MKYPRTILAILAALLGLGTITISMQCTGPSVVVNVSESPDVNPPIPLDELGWAGPDEVAAAKPIVAGMQPFQIVGNVTDNTRANVRLWEFNKQALGGQPFPCRAQQTGDCVAWGAKHACELLILIQYGEYREVDPCYIYGASRVNVGRNHIPCRSPGSVGAWAAEAVRTEGVLFITDPGVPVYSGRRSDDWGCRGPPLEFAEIARERIVQSTALISTPEEARDALCNGYPVTIASGWGTRTFSVRDDRRVADGNGSWPHQMCLIGFDGSASEPYWYVLNSWGPSAHPSPMQGEPPGGFWIRRRDLQRILSARDSFAFSAFDGFPSVDFSIFDDAIPPGPNPGPGPRPNPFGPIFRDLPEQPEGEPVNQSQPQ